MTPLMSAVVRGHLCTVRALLRCPGVDVDVRGHLGLTAIMMAVLKGGFHGDRTHCEASIRQSIIQSGASGQAPGWQFNRLFGRLNHGLNHGLNHFTVLGDDLGHDLGGQITY